MGKKTNNYLNENASQSTAVTQRSFFVQKIVVIAVLVLICAFFLVATLKYINFDLPERTEISNTTTTITKSANKITNGGFDHSIDYDNLAYPHIAHNWTVTADEQGKIMSGAISTNADEWNAVQGKINQNLADNQANYTLENPYTPTTDPALSDEQRQLASKLLNDASKDTDKNQVFMLTNMNLTFARITSSNFTIEADKFYKISFWAKTFNTLENNGLSVLLKSKASATTTVDDKSSSLRFKSIETNGSWTMYEFIVRANESSSKTMYVEFGLGYNSREGATGTAFIDNIICNEITAGEYGSKVKNLSSTQNVLVHSYYTVSDDSVNIAKIYNENQVAELQALSQNPEFIYQQNATQDWIDIINADEYIATEQAVQDDTVYFPFVSDTTGDVSDVTIYKITNNIGTQGVGGIILSNLIEDNNEHPLTVNKYLYNDYYAISMYVRTVGMNPDTGANIYLNSSDNTYSSSHTSISTPSNITEDIMNGWVKYSFYVSPSETEDVTLWLEAYVGSRTQNADNNINQKGTLYITQLEVNKITRAEYNNTSSATHMNKFQLSKTIGSSSVVNGLFNTYSPNESINSYPYAPASWVGQFGSELNYSFVENGNVITDNNGNVAYPVTFGIINSQETAKNAEYGIDSTAFVASGFNNALYINNNIETAFGVRSKPINLTMNTFFRFSVIAKEDMGDLNIYLTGDYNLHIEGGNALSNPDRILKKTAISLGNGYTEYIFYVASGANTKSVYIEIWNGSKDGSAKTQGAILVDSVNYSTITKDDFTAEVEDLGYVFPEDSDDTNPVLFVKTSENAKYDNVVFYDVRLSDVENDRPEDVVIEDDEEEEEEDDSSNSGNFNFSGDVIATILLVGALLAVVIIIIIRKRKQSSKVSAWKRDEKNLK